MSEASFSFVDMPSDRVRELAKACVLRIRDEREAMRSEHVRGVLHRYDNSWWRKLIGPRPSEEEARRSLHDKVDALFSYGDMIDSHKAHKLMVASRLLVASDHADTVKVSVHDLCAII